MRVAVVTTSYPRTATDPHGHFVARTAEGIAERGVTVSAWAPHEAGAVEREMRNGVDVHRFRYASDPFERVAYGPGVVSNVRSDPRAAVGLVPFLLSLRKAAAAAAREADLLHIHWAQTATLSGATSLRTPYVLTIHGSDLQLAARPGFAWTLSRAIERAAAVLAVSEDLAAKLAPYLPEGQVAHPVRGGVEGSLLDIPLAEDTSHLGDPVRIVFVGRLVPEKGIYELAEALGRIGTGFELDIIGVGHEEQSLRQRFAEAGLSDKVRFLGKVVHAEVLEHMRTADLVVMPSHREGCGLVPIEAAAVGTAVVVTRTGAMPEVAGCPESVVEPRDVDALTRSISMFITDPGLRRSCAETGRARVREDFTWDRITDQTLEIYERVLGERVSAERTSGGGVV